MLNSLASAYMHDLNGTSQQRTMKLATSILLLSLVC